MKPVKKGAARSRPTANGLSSCVTKVVDNYFKDLNGHQASGLYRLIISQVEKPLFEGVLKHCDGNIGQVAKTLGLNRGTVLNRLKKHRLKH